MSESRIRELYAEMEKHDPGSEESKRIAEQILDAVFGGVPQGDGGTVHAPGCDCGFCKIGDTGF